MGEGERFRNEPSAFLPRNLYTDIDEFIMKNHDYFYKGFVEFWSSHNSFHPCQLKSENADGTNLCSAAIICDGHMKIRRRLCANADVPLVLAEHFNPIFNNFMVGCSHTPDINNKFCVSCSADNVKPKEKKQYRTKKQTENLKRKWNALTKKNTNDMSNVSIIKKIIFSTLFLYM
jgi:hypothetical protein